MRTSPRANMRGDVLSSQPARLARKGRCQGAAVRATRETSRRGSHDKARPGREDTFHQRRRRRRKRQDAKSKNTGKARKAPALRRAPRCDAHLPRKAAKKETPRREKQEHGKSPQSAPRRVPDVKGKATGGSHNKARPGRERAFIKKSGEGLDARARKARSRRRPTKRAPPRAGRECTSLKEGGEEWAPRCEKQEHGKSPQSAPRRVPDVKGKATGGSHNKARPGRERAFIKKSGEGLDARARKARPRGGPQSVLHHAPRREKQEHGKSPQSAPRRVPDVKGKATGGSHNKARPGRERAFIKKSGEGLDARARKARPRGGPQSARPPPRPGRERQGHGEAVTKKRALARMRSLPPGVAMRAARAPCVVSPSQSRRMESRHACSPRHGAFRRSAFFPGG